MIYFDNASTTRMDDSVIEAMNRAFKEEFANPSSLHRLGFEGEKKLRKYRSKLAKSLGVNLEQILFAPSATLANSSVLMSFVPKTGNIIVSKTEHSSVINNLKAQEGLEVRFVEVDNLGFVKEDDLLEKVDEDTQLVSIIHVQNELGSINDINRLSKLVKEKNPKALFHSDGVQAFKKIEVDLRNIDFYTVSAHKINGPKGIAALYVRDKNLIHPFYYGGGQEKGFFSGTENTYAIAGFAKAAELENNFLEITNVNKYMRNEIEKIDGVKSISHEKNSSPYILNICIDGIGAEILLHYLEMDDIYISTGSACSKGGESRVLKAIGLSDEKIKGCIRISFDRNSNLQEAKDFVKVLKEKIELIRRIVK